MQRNDLRSLGLGLVFPRSPTAGPRDTPAAISHATPQSTPTHANATYTIPHSAVGVAVLYGPLRARCVCYLHSVGKERWGVVWWLRDDRVSVV